MMGGMSLGVRITLLREGLIFGVGEDGNGAGYILSWAMIAVLGVLGGLWITLAKFQRSGMVCFFFSFFLFFFDGETQSLLVAFCLCCYGHFSCGAGN